MNVSLTKRYEDRLVGVWSCYDRVVITGTLPGACYAAGMTSFLKAHDIRIFDYPRFAEPLRERIRARAQALTAAAGRTIEPIAKAHLRKAEVVAAVLKERGDHSGLVPVISAMEACHSYRPWHDKRTGKTFLRPDSGKCLHDYFDFIEPELGLIDRRVPTWCPFRLQFYCNGHRWLARTLTAAGSGWALADHAFLRMDDGEPGQPLADRLSPDRRHARLDDYAAQCCPVFDVFHQPYHWSLMQVEYATDLVFRSAATLQPLYATLSRQAILSVKAEPVATFLGNKITPPLAEESGSRFNTRIAGTGIKHRLGPVSVKMYDQLGRVLRVETTTNNVSFFKHHRTVEHRNGSSNRELAPLKNTIDRLIDLREILLGGNRRYLDHLSALEDFSAGHRALNKLVGPKQVDGHTLKGFNFFDRNQHTLLCALQRPDFNLRGIRRADLKPLLPDLSAASITRCLRRLRQFHLIKKVANRYYLTRLGRHAIAACCRLTEQTLIPALA